MRLRFSFLWQLGLLPWPFSTVAQVTKPTSTPTVFSYQASGGSAPLAVSPTPYLDLGGTGDEERAFNWIIAVRRQASGRVLVATFDPIRIRVFSPEGQFLAAFGRKGEGPGEYIDLSDLAVLPGDSLAVLDRMIRRITILAPDGRYVSSLPFKAPFATPPFDVSVHPFADGSLLIAYAEASVTRPSPEPVTFFQHAARYSTKGIRLDTLGRFFYGQYFLQTTSPERGDQANWDRAFGRRGVLVTAGRTFFAGDAAEAEVRRYSAGGTLLEIHRVGLPEIPVTPAIIAKYRKDELASAAPDRRAVEERRVREMPYPHRFPAYGRILVDSRGRIWMQRYTYPNATPNQWWILDPPTRRARPVLLPPRFYPYVIGKGDILGTWRDPDDVEHVRGYRLVF